MSTSEANGSGPLGQGSGCRVEAVVSVDERGQMILPKDLRQRLNLEPGEKLAIVAWDHEGETCCLSLLKTEKLTGLLTDLLGPMMTELQKK